MREAIANQVKEAFPEIAETVIYTVRLTSTFGMVSGGWSIGASGLSRKRWIYRIIKDRLW